MHISVKNFSHIYVSKAFFAVTNFTHIHRSTKRQTDRHTDKHNVNKLWYAWQPFIKLDYVSIIKYNIICIFSQNNEIKAEN